MTRAWVILAAALALLAICVAVFWNPWSSPEPAGVTTPWFLTGRVHDPEDRAVRGAIVRADIRRGDVETQLPSVLSDAMGNYQIDLGEITSWPRLVRATAVLTVRPDADGYMPGSSSDVQLYKHAPGKTIQLDLAVAPGGRVTGRVVDASGEPLAGVSVEMRSFGRTLTITGRRTDDEGRYVFGARGACDCRLQASLITDETITEPIEVEVGEGATVEVPDMVARPFTFVEGVVLLADGSPVPDVMVLMKSAEEEPDGWGVDAGDTDEEGRFRIRVLEGSRHRLWVYPSVPGSGEVSCEAGDRDVRIVIDAARLVLRVVDPEGRPLPGSWLDGMGWPPDDPRTLDALLAGELSREEARYRSFDVLQGGVRDASGVGTWYVARESSWLLSAHVSGGASAETAVKLEPGQDLVELTLVVQETVPAPAPIPTGRLALELTAPDGTRILEYTVDVASISGTKVAHACSDQEGQLPALHAGRVRLTISPGVGDTWLERKFHIGTFYLPMRCTVEIPEDGTLPLRLQARQGGRFRLRLRYPAGGQPQFESANVTIRAAGDPEATPRPVVKWITGEGEDTWVTDNFHSQDACVNAHLLEPADYLLTVETQDHGTYERELRILPGEIADVVIDLAR